MGEIIYMGGGISILIFTMDFDIDIDIYKGACGGGGILISI